MTVFEKINAQQKGKEYTDAWIAGEQLKDILRENPSLQELVDKDLDVPDMSLVNCAKKIEAWADEQHKKMKCNRVGVPSNVAEGIIRKFYGLPEAGAVSEHAKASESDILDFADFL